MKAAFHVGKEKVELRDVACPTASKNECLVEVKACAICGSDGWWLHEGLVPGIQGHEVTGVIVEVGEEVKSWKKGDRVAVYCVTGCGECDPCKRDMDPYCQRGASVVAGGFAEYVAVPARSLLPLGLSFDFIEGSLLTDTVGTPMRALRRIEIPRGGTVAVWGLGPLGNIAVQGAKALGAGRVIGLDPLLLRRKLAQELGADMTLDPNQANVESVLQNETGGVGVDACVCTIRNDEVAQRGCNLVRRGGWFVSVAGKALIGGEFEIYGSGVKYFAKSEYKPNVEFVKSGCIKLKPIITHIFPLDQIQEAFVKRFKQKDLAMKVVIKTSK